MAENWEGFTTEEIQTISSQKHTSKDLFHNSTPVKKITLKENRFGKKNNIRERMLKPSKKLQFSTRGNEPGVPQKARQLISEIPEEEGIEEAELTVNKNIEDPLSMQPKHLDDAKNCIPNNHSEMNYIDSSVLLLSTSKDTSLDDFERKQNMIKEQNRQRKELLKKALEDRTKKTHEEVRRLSQIEEELKKLDNLLSSDVSILRNQIEVASLEFMEAQKRFDRAEREYLDAKLALFTKKERKELLTGHLCTIIEQNDLRKAKKLSELMNKLHLGSVIIEKPMELQMDSNNSESKENKSKSLTPPMEDDPSK